MSFETEKHKIYTIWKDTNNNSIKLEGVINKQNQKETQIKQTLPNITQFNNIYTLNSEWMPILPVGVSSTGTYTNKCLTWSIEKIIPESKIPYARINVAYRRIDGIDIFADTSVYLNQFSQIIDVQKKNEFGLPNLNYVQNLKRVIWNISFVQNKNSTPPDWYDYELKLFFTLINPQRITAS